MLPVAVEMLPEGYRRLEYLESTGTQWINTGVNIDNDSEVSCTFESREKEYTYYEAIFGTRTDFLNGITLFYPASTIDNGILVFASNFGIPAEFGKKTSVKLNKTELKCGDLQHNNSGSITGELTNMLLFCVNTNGGGENVHDNYHSKARIYSFSISRNGQLQINLIPCLDAKGKPCMFDTVSCQPFYNGGTGEFLYELPGDGELPAGYTRLEYLESTGTQYIDTGIKLSNESEVMCKGTRAKQRNVVAFVYGARQTYYVEAFTFLANDGSGYSRFQYDEQLITTDSIDGDFEIKQSGNLCFLNDNLITTFQEDVFETPVSAFLFYVNEQKSSGYTPCICKIHSFSISRAGTPQLNFIPCLDDKGVPCMFDTVTRRPFRNAATTGPDFLYG